MARSGEDRVKVLILGPSQCGKSNMANVLGGQRDTPTESYRETCPVRIFERVVEGLNTTGTGKRIGRGARATVEIWDVGGSSRFQNTWPAIKQEADAIIFMMNADVEPQAKELEFWHKAFHHEERTPATHCIVFVHRSTPTDVGSPPQLPQMPRALSTCRVFETSLDQRSDDFKDAFERLVEQVLVTRRRREEEEAMRDDMTHGMRIGRTQ